MDLLTNIIEDFIFFSFLESIIFCLYFRKFGNCSKFTYKDIFIIGLVNCVVSQVIPPLLYQLIMAIWMGLYLKLNKNKTLLIGLYLSFSGMMLMLIVEMIMAMFYEYILHLNFMNFSILYLFLAIIPIKIIELLLIIGGDRMKGWFGEIEKKK